MILNILYRMLMNIQFSLKLYILQYVSPMTMYSYFPDTISQIFMCLDMDAILLPEGFLISWSKMNKQMVKILKYLDRIS